jgi:hypothetical protein
MSQHKRYTIGNGELHFINHEGFSDVSGTAELASLQYCEVDRPLSTGPILLTREFHLDIECYSPKGLVFLQGQSLGKSESTIPEQLMRNLQLEAYAEWFDQMFGIHIEHIRLGRKAELNSSYGAIGDTSSKHFELSLQERVPVPQIELQSWAREAVKQILADTYNHQPPFWAKSWKRKGKHR